MALKNIVFVICIGAVWAQTTPSLSDALNNLPPELQGKVDEKQITELKNKTTEVFKKKCEENGGPDAFKNSQSAGQNFVDCMKKLINPNQLEQEIEEAKPEGKVDEVFKKYCDKKPSFKKCFSNVTEAVMPCFSADEQKNLNTVQNVSEQLVDFVCFKEGDRIALFIAENGPDCIREKQKEIETCLNNTLGADFKFNTEDISFNNIPKINFGTKECNQLSDLQVCIVSTLETCSTPTSANIVESLFKYVRKATPCKDIPETEDANMKNEKSDPVAEKKAQNNTANSLVVKSIAMGAIALALLV